MNIIDEVKQKIMKLNDEYLAKNNYDYWQEHIKYVVRNSLDLADIKNADKEIVELGALLHDIALLKEEGLREDHNKTGALIAIDILTKLNYPEEKIERVRKCVYNHRSGLDATSIEESCVSDADILAHFDNIPMLMAHEKYLKEDINTAKLKALLKKVFEEEYNDLGPETKEIFKERYNLICELILGKD